MAVQLWNIQYEKFQNFYAIKIIISNLSRIIIQNVFTQNILFCTRQYVGDTSPNVCSSMDTFWSNIYGQ